MATGTVVQAADIRASAEYAGGYVGFALTKFGGTAIYYSEYQRNANCTACAAPGHWKMMLAYRSKVHQSSYYMAFEDWEGANQETWHGNDGDFNDKVFLVTGVSCPGGGEPCDTGKPGLCAAGLTECSLMGTPQCRQQYPETAESCDNVDNDCNGVVDEGELCSPGQVCVRGTCVRRCSSDEFPCPTSFVCGDDGFCIEPECAGVTCDAGLTCRKGACVGECQGIVCPLGQHCLLDRCVDPCANVACPVGSFCDRGVCVGDCTCSGCAASKACSSDGRCVAPGCEDVSCGSAEGCRDGACVDACDGAVCPGAAACLNGLCAAPIPSSAAGGTSNDLGTGGLSIVPNAGASARPLPTSRPSGAGGSGGSGGSRPVQRADARGEPSSGCGCRAVGGRERAQVLGSGFGLLALTWVIRRSRRPSM
jgi:hypothetical protein